MHDGARAATARALLVVAAALAGCGHAVDRRPPTSPEAATTMTTSGIPNPPVNPPVRIEPGAPGEWVLHAERRHGGEVARGEVTVRAAQPPDGTGGPHGRVAGARAWLVLGHARLAAG